MQKKYINKRKQKSSMSPTPEIPPLFNLLCIPAPFSSIHLENLERNKGCSIHTALCL